MATIYSRTEPSFPNREERLANTDPAYAPRSAPYTAEQLAVIRAECKRLGGRPLTQDESDRVLGITKKALVLDGDGRLRVIEVQ